MTGKEYTDGLARLSKLVKQAAFLQKELDPINNEMELLKFALMSHMKLIHSDRSTPVDGYYLIRKKTPHITITSDAALEDWLTNEGYKVDEYKKFDTKLVKGLAERRLDVDGEKLPGLDISVTEYAQVLKAKE